MAQDHDIDFRSLRSDLMDYFGTGFMEFPGAGGDLLMVECADNSELIEIASDNGFDLSDYYIR